jgi:outer membrane scaffolding protein for murein synthesis (MipA/OmpV family)
MEKLLALALVVSCGAVSAQTPATNPMPDGSRDMYAGLGAVSMPRYQGAGSNKESALPVLQVQWSNGLFISGMSAGIHLSNRPTLEYGPLVALQPRRRESGTGSGIGEVHAVGLPSRAEEPSRRAGVNRLEGMNDIGARLQAGAFVNYYLSQEWRLTSSVLYGAGNDRDGALLELGVQRLAIQVAPHHAVSVSAGVTIANRAYNQAFFGVSSKESALSGNAEYAAAGGFKDARVGLRWNWALSPSWMLTSGAQATRLLNSPGKSPLVERPNNLTVSTAVAYRF